jgi:hypothetical protein
VKYIRVQGDKINVGRVELDFTPEWVPDPECPSVGPGAEEEQTPRKIAVPRARLSVRGSETVLEIRDLERIQRLRRMVRQS